MSSLRHSPVAVEVTRAGTVESHHIVDAAISNRDGLIEAWGDPDRPVIARSALKSVQAIPLITTGAADAFELADDELALACSSHAAESDHLEKIDAWLNRIGLTEDALECGPDRPSDRAAADHAGRAAHACSPIFNCCSGKHTGFLTTAVHLAEDPRHYIRRDHPTQQRVEKAVSTLTGIDLHDLDCGSDGCGIPVHAIPLRNLALAMAQLVDPVGLDDTVAPACRRLTALLPSRSRLVSGTGRCEVELAAAANQPLIAKSGAEGMFVAALPQHGLGIALKARDGASRAAQQGIRAVLDRLDAFTEPVTDFPVLDKAGLQIGVQRAVLSR